MEWILNFLYNLIDYSIGPVTMWLLAKGKGRRFAPLVIVANWIIIIFASLASVGVIALPQWANIWQTRPEYILNLVQVAFCGIACLSIIFSGHMEWVTGLLCLLVGYCVHEFYLVVMCFAVGRFPIANYFKPICRLGVALLLILPIVWTFRRRMTPENLENLRKRNKWVLIGFLVLFAVTFLFSVLMTDALIRCFSRISNGYAFLIGATSIMKEIGNYGTLVSAAEKAVVLIAMLSLLQYSETDFERAFYQKLYEQERAQYQQFQQKVDYINARYHDLKHCLSLLSQDRASAEGMLKSVSEDIAIIGVAINSGNNTLDNVLTDRRIKCQQKQIELHFMTDGTDFHWIDNIDLYIIFCNILDNAIEYLESRQGDKTIRLGIRCSGEMVLIHQENVLDEELEMDRNFPVSTKGESRDHGFGLRSIEKAVEKYRGTVQVIARGGRFVLNIMIPKSAG